MSQLHIGDPVTYHVGAGQVVPSFEVVGEHGRARLARGQLFVREGAVDQYLAEVHPLIGEGADDLVVCRPECLFGEGGGAEAVLVGDHHQLIFQLTGDACEVLEYAGVELQLLQAVDLLILRLPDQCSVAVDKKYFLHVILFSEVYLIPSGHVCDE